jgi:hypothetical protein
MRFIGMDVHRDFCEVAIWEAGEVRSAGRVSTGDEELGLFAQSLGHEDRVAMEMSGNAAAIARIIEPHVTSVVLADPKKVRERVGNGPKIVSTPGCWRSSAPAASSPPSGPPTRRRG